MNFLKHALNHFEKIKNYTLSHTIKFNLSDGNVSDILNKHPNCQFFEVVTEKFKSKTDNLITLAQSNDAAKKVVVELANRGFYLYNVKDQKISLFVHQNSLEHRWYPVRSGQFLSYNGIIYKLSMPKVELSPNLLVIFSSIAGKMYHSSLHRYFAQNYSSIEKYVPSNTIILRIADIGAVTGAYYFNTHYLTDNEMNIQDLISTIQQQYQTKEPVLFGISKGGTGAFYHAHLGNYNFIAVDPIVDDEHYLVRHKDLHFVQGCFPKPKIEKIREIMEATTNRSTKNGCIITSNHSPQFKYIEREIIKPYQKNYSIFITAHPDIKDHPDVAPNSMHMMTTLINNLINKIDIEKKSIHFFREKF